MRYQYLTLTKLSVALRASQLAKVGTLSLVTALTISGCGGGGTTTDQPLGAAPSASAIRALPESFVSRKAVAYSPFRTSNRDTETVTDSMVKQDLDLLVQAGIGAIRLFDSSEKVAFRTLRLIRANNMDIKVMLGMYVNTFEYETNAAKRAAVQAGNEDELARGVALANSYPDIVSAVSVGNETLVSWSFVPISTGTLANYLKQVRDQIQQPVTTDDNWAPFAGQGRNAAEQVADVLRQVDFVSMHTYSMEDAFYSNLADSDLNPDWDWQQTAVTDPTKRAAAMMDAAVGKTKKDFAAVRSFLDKSGRTNLPIVIGETGWRATDPSGTGRYKFLAGAANQKMYYSRLSDWVSASRSNGGPKNIIYFEAFDEPWKGSDDKWGLFNVQRQARCAAQYLKPAATWVKESGSCDEANATYYIPPLLQPKVATPTYVLNSEAVSGWPAGLRTDAFSGTTVEYTFTTGDSDPADSGTTLAASRYILLSSYRPTAENYGWGLLYQSAANPPVSSNLSNFANGSINFSIKTGYVGKLRIGISSDTELGSVVEANVMISKDKYGYCNDATKWCAVSIPLKDFVAANPLIDLRYILTRFSIADIWSETGNTARSGMPSISLDNIYWKQ